MHLTFEKTEDKQSKCAECQKDYLENSYYVHKNDSAYVVARLEKHEHGNQREVFISVIFGDWQKEDYENNVTFSCRYGYSNVDEPPVCSLMQEPKPAPIFGKRLDRDEASEHKLLEDFWEVVDLLLEKDASINEFIQGHTH